MHRNTFIAVCCLAGFAGTAHAQACLSYSTGFGDTTVTCPDGSTGYVHTGPGGAASGMIGNQPFAGSAASLSPPFGPAAGVPSAAYIAPPIAGPAPPAPPPSAPATGAAILSTPFSGLTLLEQEYLAAQGAKALRKPKPSTAKPPAP